MSCTNTGGKFEVCHIAPTFYSSPGTIPRGVLLILKCWVLTDFAEFNKNLWRVEGSMTLLRNESFLRWGLATKVHYLRKYNVNVTMLSRLFFYKTVAREWRQQTWVCVHTRQTLISLDFEPLASPEEFVKRFGGTTPIDKVLIANNGTLLLHSLFLSVTVCIHLTRYCGCEVHSFHSQLVLWNLW